MNYLRRTALAAAACVTVLAHPGAAQQPGDLILSAIGVRAGVYASDFSAASITTLSTLATEAVCAYGDSVLFATTGSTPRLMTTDGQSTSIWSNLFPGTSPTGLERAQDGSFLLTTKNRTIYRIEPAQVLALKTFSVGVNGLTRDLDTGHYAVVSGNDGKVFEWDPAAGAYTTMSTLSAARTSSIVHMPSGDFAIGIRQTNGLYVGPLDGSGTLLPVPHVNAVCGDHATNTVWAATTAGQVYKIRGTVFVDSRSYDPMFAFTGIDVFGGEKVAMTKGIATNKVNIDLTFLQSPNRGYCVALSFGVRPGIPFAGMRKVNLQPDDLFFLTACTNIPGLTKSFVGTTDAQGRATAEVTLPNGAPAFRFYASAAAINKSFPGGLELANTAMVDVPASGP